MDLSIVGNLVLTLFRTFCSGHNYRSATSFDGAIRLFAFPGLEPLKAEFAVELPVCQRLSTMAASVHPEIYPSACEILKS